jgi:very-short-patch-repair endonuclease
MSLLLNDRIMSLAGEQHGLVTRRQLLETGLTPDQIKMRVKRRRYCPVHRGVYLVGPPIAPHLREMAAVLACGPGAVVSHRSAGALWNLLPPCKAPAPVDILVPVRHREHRPGIRAHRTSRLDPGETTNVERIPVTSPARTVLDLAGKLGPQELERVLSLMEREGLSTLCEVSSLIEGHPRRPGSGLLRALVRGEASPTLTRSEAEERFLALVRKAKLPRPEVNMGVAGYEVDFFWRPQGLVVEVDGFAFHASRRAFKRDRRRDAALLVKGVRVIRITWDQLVREPEAVVALVTHGLASSGRR